MVSQVVLHKGTHASMVLSWPSKKIDFWPAGSNKTFLTRADDLSVLLFSVVSRGIPVVTLSPFIWGLLIRAE